MPRSFGVDPAQADRAVAVMAQSLANRIERNTLSRGGLADVVDLLARPGAGAALQEPQALSSPQVEAIGNSVLDVLIGSKHVSRGIAQSAARASGIDEATLRKMLPAVASMVIGSLQAKAMPQIEKSLQPLKISASPLPLPGDATGTRAQRSGSQRWPKPHRQPAAHPGRRHSWDRCRWPEPVSATARHRASRRRGSSRRRVARQHHPRHSRQRPRIQERRHHRLHLEDHLLALVSRTFVAHPVPPLSLPAPANRKGRS